MTKRTFFKSFMGLVATVALAPEIAFGVRLRVAEVWQPAEFFACNRTAYGFTEIIHASTLEGLKQAMKITGVPENEWTLFHSDEVKELWKP